MHSLTATLSRQAVVALLALTAGLGIAAAAPREALRPNIVVILADDLGYSDLGCYGSEIATPNLDKLAAGGMQLTQFYTTPRCCPTRAALLTGLYPQQAGIGNMMEDRGLPGYRGELNHNTPTIAEDLRAANYHTLMVGKWHVSHIYFEGKKQLNYETDTPFWENKNNWPMQRGFDEFFGTIHGVNSYFDPFALVDGNTPIRATGSNFYYTDKIAAQAVEFLGEHKQTNQPFFMYVAFTAPHWPLQAPEEDIARYRQTYRAGWDVIRSNRYQRQIEMGIIPKSWPLSPRDERVPAWEKAADPEWEANRMATYAAMVSRLDHGVGQIMAKLKDIGADQNTLVMFLSDNGACEESVRPNWYDVPSKTRDGRPITVGNEHRDVMAGPDTVWQSYGPPWANVSDTPFRLYKHFVHEGGIATPFIASWPKVIKPGAPLNRAIGHVTDIMATCVALAGGEHPATFNGAATQPLEGTSLLPIFEAKSPPDRTPLFWEHEGNRAVRLGKWKLVARHNRNWELYDIEADRTESKDVAAQNPERVKKLAALYHEWAQRCQVVPPEDLPPQRAIVPAPASSAKHPAARAIGA